MWTVDTLIIGYRVLYFYCIQCRFATVDHNNFIPSIHLFVKIVTVSYIHFLTQPEFAGEFAEKLLSTTVKVSYNLLETS